MYATNNILTNKGNIKIEMRKNIFVCSQKHGQINIEFTGGAVLFFITLIFVITSVFAILPKYAETSQKNNLENIGWTLSELIINDPGYWSSGNESGFDWENHLKYIKTFGLAKDYHQLSENKIAALPSLSYEKVKTILGIDKNFQFNIKEFLIINCIHTFEKHNLESTGLTGEPSDSFYKNADSTVHLGTKLISGRKFYFLIAQKEDNFMLYISPKSNFSQFSKYNSSKPANITLESQKFMFSENNGIKSSKGNIVILNREIIKYGRNMTGLEKQVLVFKRFAELNGSIAKLSLKVW